MNPNLQMFGQMAQQPPQMPPQQPQGGPPMQGQPPQAPMQRPPMLPPQQGQPQITPQLLAMLQQRMGQQPQAQKFTPQEMASLGRFGDSIMAHQTPGEITVPLPVQTPKVLATLKNAFHKQHADMSQFVAGSPTSRINPKTGAPEYYMSWIQPVFSLGGAAIGGYFGGPMGASAGSTAGGVIGGLIAGQKNSQVANDPNQLPLPSGFNNGMTPTNQLPSYQQLLGQNNYQGPRPVAYPGDLNKYGFGPGFNFLPQPPAPTPSAPPVPPQATQMPLTGAVDPSLFGPSVVNNTA